MAGKRLVILGGGFGGLDVARAIGRSAAARRHWDTVLIDKENFFQFNPLLPAIASGAVETRHIVYPLRDMAHHRHIRFMKNKVESIDLDRRTVRLHNDLVIPYELLVIGIGSVTNDYGVPGVAEHTRPFKTIVDAMWVRARIVELFEMAEQAESDAQRRRLLSFLIVGGGVTGVEVAAEMLEMARETLLPRYPRLDRSCITLTVLERGDRLTPTALPAHSRYIHRYLERHGAVVRLNARVMRVEEKRVTLDSGEAFEAFTILWTAGVHPPEVVRALPLTHVRDGRVRVDAFLHPLDPQGRPVPDVCVIGDCAAAGADEAHLQPALAQSALEMGRHLGRQLVRMAHGEAPQPIAYRPHGYIISLGKHGAAADLFGIAFAGRVAWLLWAGAYLVKMVGFTKQLEVAIDHITHVFYPHDASQILNRREVLSDEELNLSLAPRPPAEAVRRAASG